MSGRQRARGRARGRAREPPRDNRPGVSQEGGVVLHGGGSQAAPRSGVSAPVTSASAHVTNAPAPTSVNEAASGSRNYGAEGARPKNNPAPANGRGRGMVVRGAGDGRPQVSGVIAGMQQLSIGDGGGDQGGFQQREFLSTKPNINPKKMAAGVKRFSFVTNHVAVEVDQSAVLYNYHVTFSPEVENVRLRRRVVMVDLRDLFEGRRPVYDGNSKLTTHVRLPQAETARMVQVNAVTVRVTLTFGTQLFFDSPDFLQFANVLLRNFQKNQLRMTQIGRHYYDMEGGRVQVPGHRLDVVSGMEASIAMYDYGLAMQFDISHKVLRDETALMVMQDIEQKGSRDLFRDACRALLGAVVMTKYNNKTYRIIDIDGKLTPRDSFQTRDGSVTYLDYFAERYNIHLREPNQWMLVIKGRDKRDEGRTLYLPPELAYMTGLTDGQKKNMKLMKDMHQHTRVNPPDRLKRLLNWAHKVTNHGEAETALVRNGVHIRSQLMHVGGHVIEPVTLLTGSEPVDVDAQKADWSSQQCSNRFRLVSPVRMRDWLIVYPRRSSRDVNKFWQMCSNAMETRTGFRPPDPQMVEVADNLHIAPLINTLKDVCAEREQVGRLRELQMVVVVLPSNRADKYGAVKRLLQTEIPVQSQCIVEKTIRLDARNLMSIITKIADQMQAKMGAELWRLLTPRNMPGILVMGQDTFHDNSEQRVDRQLRSVVACVSSTVPSFSRYLSQAEFQPRRAEINDHAESMAYRALKRWYQNNNGLPKHMVVYRDGVGDGQLTVVSRVEVEAVQKALDKIMVDLPEDTVKPTLTFIVVKKRINARFFLQTPSGVSNPRPGTVVDNTVTNPTWTDFFLVSQSVRAGTLSPSHYNVICDNSGIPTLLLQKLTYWQAHMYYNWAGTIATPTVCKLADRLAQHIGQHIHRQCHPALEETLYYL